MASLPPDRRRTPTWGPIERLAALLDSRIDAPAIEVAAFMYMGCVRSASDIEIHLYKHSDTRRYLNLDTCGHAYSFVSLGEPGRSVVILPDVLTAVARTLLEVADPPANKRAPNTPRGRPIFSTDS